MVPSPALCDFGPSHFLLFGPDVGPLQYYSHLPIIVISLALAVFILVQNRKALANQVLFSTIIVFVLWVFFDSIIWATNRSDVIMFMWSLQILIEPLVYIGSLYLLYVLIQQRDVPFSWKSIWFLFYLPLIVAAPTALNLAGFDSVNCLSTEGPIGHYYSYFAEISIVIWIIVYAVASYFRAVERTKKIQISLLAIGVLLFLVAFSWGNITGSFTEDWQLAQYGLFGMPVFTGFLVYSIVKYRTFDTRLIGSVALVLFLCALNFSLLFVEEVSVFRGVALATFVLAVAFGAVLIRGIAREVQQRERIEKLAVELQQTNERQEGLIRFISHEVKGFLAKDAGAFAALDEGDFGVLPDALKPFVERALAQTRDGVDSVMDILKASNIKKGTVSYQMGPFDLAALAAEIAEKAKPLAAQKGLTLTYTSDPAGAPYTLNGDTKEIGDHVLRNLIENSINYTPSGTIDVSLKKENGKFIYTVKDTGIGITDEDKTRLFTEGGHGKDSQKVNVHSTGYGLFIAKNIVTAHQGTIRGESEGAGKGSTFTVELPA